MSNEFEITGWNETPYLEIDEQAKFTRTVISKKYSGDIEGEGRLDYLMAYNADGSANFVGIERVTGTVSGKNGSFSIREQGTYVNGTVTSTFIVLSGSGNGELGTIEGQGSYTTGNAPKVSFEFDYTV